MIFRNSRSGGFTLIEVMIVVAVIGILAAVALLTFRSFRQKSAIASCLASAHSIQASLLSYATSNSLGSFPDTFQSWDQLAGVCNMNGSRLSSAAKTGFQNWISYTAVDLNSDGITDEYQLLLRVSGIPNTREGAQIEISSGQITKQTY